MSWFNEFECFFLFVLVMKLAVLWAAAACVAAVELPCEDYCICLSKESQELAYQPECNCNDIIIESERKHRERPCESKIYYEPIEYLPVPSSIIDHPFVIFNPYAAMRKKHFAQTAGTKIQINIENTHTPHNRREKDTLSDDSTHTIYLDIDLEPNNARTVLNVPTPEDLNLTKESLIECATLYTVLDSRKTRNPKLTNTKSQDPFAKYNLSDAELIQEIEAKCSQFSYIIEKSQKEIKDNRPKKPTDSLKMAEGEQQPAKNARDEPLGKTLEQDFDSETIHSHLATNSNEKNRNAIDKQKNEDERKGYTVVIYTESESNEYSYENLPTTSPQETDIGQASSDVTESSHTVRSQNFEDAFTTTERVTYPYVASFDDEREYVLNAKTASFLTSPTSESTTSRTITDEDLTEDLPFIDQELVASDKVYEGRPHQNENGTELPKIITHEFNNTVESFVDGTEDFVSGESEDVQNRSFEDLGEQSDVSNDGEITTIPRVSIDTSDLSGKMYFVYKRQHIPLKFVQLPNGTLNLGIDGEALCYKLIQDGERKSTLLTTLCNCYKYDNCSSVNRK